MWCGLTERASEGKPSRSTGLMCLRFARNRDFLCQLHLNSLNSARDYRKPATPSYLGTRQRVPGETWGFQSARRQAAGRAGRSRPAPAEAGGTRLTWLRGRPALGRGGVGATTVLLEWGRLSPDGARPAPCSVRFGSVLDRARSLFPAAPLPRSAARPLHL